jgi:hypothetical protein
VPEQHLTNRSADLGGSAGYRDREPTLRTRRRSQRQSWKPSSCGAAAYPDMRPRSRSLDITSPPR